MRVLGREIPINRKYFMYDDPNNIEVKAGYYEEDSDYGLIRCLYIDVIDSTYNKDKPEHYEMSFNCDHLKEQKDQDWMVNVLAPYMVKFILKSRDKQVEHISKKCKEFFDVLRFNIF